VIGVAGSEWKRGGRRKKEVMKGREKGGEVGGRKKELPNLNLDPFFKAEFERSCDMFKLGE
jgi:hypothetical protein